MTARKGKRAQAGTKRPDGAGAEPAGGTGALCAEAQADGVPCPDLGRECEQCERAVRSRPDPAGPSRDDGGFLDRAFRTR